MMCVKCQEFPHRVNKVKHSANAKLYINTNDDEKVDSDYWQIIAFYDY